MDNEEIRFEKIFHRKYYNNFIENIYISCSEIFENGIYNYSMFLNIMADKSLLFFQFYDIYVHVCIT